MKSVRQIGRGNVSGGRRLESLDALRGFDMLWIMGFAAMVQAFCVFIGHGDCWLARQMDHVPWHGFHHHDTIFPLFLFLAGVSWPFSFAGSVKRGLTRGRLFGKIFGRVVLLTFLGLICEEFFRFDFAHVRYDSVLCHIGVCWGVAATVSIIVRGWRTRLALASGLLLLHWAILWLFIAPDTAALQGSSDLEIVKALAPYAAVGDGHFSFAGNIAGWIDRLLMPGVLYENVFDPDGLLSKLTGIALALFGVLAGEVLRSSSTERRKIALLSAASVLGLVLGIAWEPWCPVNKKLWTSTFVLIASAYSFAMLAAFHWVVDVLGWRKWTFFFRVIGRNSITIYVAAKIIWFGGLSRFFFGGVAGWGNADFANLVYLAGQVLIEWLCLLFLFRKNIFLKV